MHNRHIYTKNASRQQQTALRAVQRHKSELERTRAQHEEASTAALDAQAAVQDAQGALAKSQADAQTAVDTASKKDKAMVEEEWKEKIAEAEEHLRKQRAILNAAEQERDQKLAQIAAVQSSVDTATVAEQELAAVLETRKDAAHEKVLMIKRSRRQEREQHQAHMVVEAPSVRPQTATARQTIRLQTASREPRPKSANVFDRQRQCPPPTIDFQSVFFINEQSNASFDHMLQTIKASQQSGPSRQSRSSRASMLRPRSATLSRTNQAASYSPLSVGRPSSAYVKRNETKTKCRPKSAVYRR